MEPIQIPYNFTPRPYQAKLFMALDGIAGKPETKIKRAFIRWHRRSGKDKACFCYMVKEACQVPGNYYYVFPNLTMARDAFWNNVDKDGFRVINHLPEKVIKRKREDEMFFELISGSTIKVIGLEDFDRKRGISAKGVVFSEFAFQPAEGYKIFMIPLRQTKGWAIFNSTPNGKNHMYDMEQRNKDNPNWYISVLQTMWPDQPNYSGEYDAEQLKEIQIEDGYTMDQMEQEYGVSYISGTSGAYYLGAIQAARESNRIGYFDPKPELGMYTFWDLGYGDSTAVWFVQFEGNRIMIVDYLEDANKDLMYYAAILKNKGYNYIHHYFPHDGSNGRLQTGMTTAEQFRRLLANLGINSRCTILPKPGRALDGINKTRALMSRMYFNEPKVAEGIKHLEIYRKKFNRQTNTFMDEPYHDEHSHAADALRTLAISDIDTHNSNRHSKGSRQRSVISNYNPFNEDF